MPDFQVPAPFTAGGIDRLTMGVEPVRGAQQDAFCACLRMEVICLCAEVEASMGHPGIYSCQALD